MSAVLEKRVDRLEEALADFTTSVGIEFNKVYNSQLMTQKGLRELQEEMRAFKEEMRADREAGRREQVEMNRKWGDISNKLGTLVEDLVYPSLSRIVRETFGEEPRQTAARLKRRLPDGRCEELDALAVTDELVVVNSTKASLRSADVDDFAKQIERFRTFFPEYAALPAVGLLVTLSVEDSVLRYAERTGFLVAAIGERLMELRNRPGFVPRRWG